MDREVLLTPSLLWQWMADKEIKLAFLTTQLAEALLDVPYPEHLSLRYLYTGGDKLHRGPRAGAPFKLVNIYGPTENTVNSTMCVVPAGSVTAPPIGKPVPNTQVYIVDKKLRPVPIGVYGELYLAGVQLARGYFRRPDLTSERFVSNVFSDEPGSVMYRTGDLVRWLADGSIEFLGRADTQVKIRGYRIELGAIESVLYEREEVKEVCVIAREVRPGDKRLVAYIVGDRMDVKAYVGSRLPEFMVPSAVMWLESMPLNPNGKIIRSALPAPDAVDMGLEDYVAPSNDLEEKLAALYCEVLDLKRVSVDASFFDLGGHSLLAALLGRFIRERLGLSFAFTVLWASPSVQGLAAVLTPSSVVKVPSVAVKSKTQSPGTLSRNQSSLLFLHELGG